MVTYCESRISTRRRASERPVEVALRTAPLRVTLAALQAGPVVILALLVVVLSVLSDVFFSLENFGNVLKQSAVISRAWRSGSCW